MNDNSRRMRAALAATAMLWTGVALASTPGRDVIDTCMEVRSTAQHVTYSEWPADDLVERDDEATGRSDVVLRHAGQSVGVWSSASGKLWGLSVNGMDIPERDIVRLDTKSEPYKFSLQSALAGEIRSGAHSYLCMTFYFEGADTGGPGRNIRAMYLIANDPYRVYYATLEKK